MIEIPLPSSSHIAHEVIERLVPYLSYENGPWVAGGALRRLVMGDIKGEFDVDIFFRDKAQHDQLKVALEGEKFHTHPFLRRWELKTSQMEENQGKTYYKSKAKDCLFGFNDRIQVQYIDNFFFKSADELLNDFDFTVVQLVSDGRTIRYSPITKEHIDKRILSLNPNSQIRQMNRLCRYMSYGFKPDRTMLADMEHNPRITYYRKNETFDKIDTNGLEHSDELQREIDLSRVTNVHISKIKGQDIAFLSGIPFPVALAYIYLVSNEMREAIVSRMKPFWGNEVPKDLEGIENKVTAMSLVKAYMHTL